MNTKKEHRVWIAHKPYNQSIRASVHYCPINGLWIVKQKEIEVIMCSDLCLKDVKFCHSSWEISGLIATFKEVRDKHDEIGHDEEETFEMTVITISDKGFYTELNIPIYKCPYLDMSSYDADSMIAIFPTTI